MAMAQWMSFYFFVIYISGAKLNEYCFNIFGDMFDWVMYCVSETTFHKYL